MKKKQKFLLASVAALGVLSGSFVLGGCSATQQELGIRVFNDVVQWTNDGETWQDLISVKDLGGDGSNYTISADGYWIIDGKPTEHKAVGTDGQGIVSIVIDEVNSTEEKSVYIINYSGGKTVSFEIEHPKADITSVVSIDENGYWCIDGVPTKYKAAGDSGSKIESVTENTEKSTEEETVYTIKYEDGTEFEFKVKNGVDGEDGEEAAAPTIEIVDGNWHIGGKDTGVRAEGKDGKNGTEVTISENGYWVLDGEETDVLARGQNGNGIASFESKEEEGKTIYTITFDDKSTHEIVVKHGTDGTNGSVITIGADGCWHIDGQTTNIKVRYEYRVTYDYVYGGKMKAEFDNFAEYQDIEPTAWLTEMPMPKATCRGDFAGWFIKGTNKKIENYDFIGGNVTLEARWNYLPSGHYQDGEYLSTWEELKVAYPDAFATSGEVKGRDSLTYASYLRDLSGEIVVDEEITTIGEYAFRLCDKLTKVMIPKSVSLIEFSAFEDCRNLSSIKIAEGVTTIQGNSFRNCISLKNVEIPDSVKEIGVNAFLGCTGLETVKLPKNLAIISGGMFDGCSSLTSIAIPESVTELGYHSFNNCTSLKTITIPSNVEDAFHAFEGCTSLEEIIIDSEVVANENFNSDLPVDCLIYVREGISVVKGDIAEGFIKSSTSDKRGYNFYKAAGLYQEGKIVQSWKQLRSAFPDAFGGYHIILGKEDGYVGTSYLKDLSGELVLPAIVSKIDDYAFRECKSLTNIVLSENVTVIGDYSFSNCTGLSELILNEGLTEIGNGAFANCSKLAAVVIPSTVTAIEFSFISQPFYGCESLSQIVVASGNTVYDSRGNCNAIIETATNKLLSGCKNTTIPESVTAIGDVAFGGSGITSIVIPKQIATIGNQAFSRCNSLTSIVVDSENEVYDSRDNCNAIIETASNTLQVGCISTVIPNGVEIIESYAFYLIDGWMSITIPDSVTTICSFAFDFVDIKSITIPSSVTTIENYAFSSNFYLDVVTIDSQAAASNLSKNGLIEETSTLYIKTGLTVEVSETLTNNFTKQETSDKDGYDMYTRNN